MSFLKVASGVVLALLGCTFSASAQDLRGFVSAGVSSDLNQRGYLALGGGALVDLGRPWLSAGVQGESFVSWPYASGRMGIFGQANLTPRKPVSPFVLTGIGIGENSGTLIGGGVELRPAGHRLGFRLAVEDYAARYRGSDGSMLHHQIGFRAGVQF